MVPTRESTKITLQLEPLLLRRAVMKIASYNVNSIRRRLPLVLDWVSLHKPDVMCLQETKVQDQDFPADAFRDVGYHATFRGMKGYNGVATLTRQKPERILHGLHEGPDNEDVRILQTVVEGIPIINSYVPQGYSISSEKYAFKLAWFQRIRRYFEAQLDSEKPAIWLGDLNVAPEPNRRLSPRAACERCRFPHRCPNRLQSFRCLGVRRCLSKAPRRSCAIHLLGLL
jgi:exodeoxyribonuclease III